MQSCSLWRNADIASFDGDQPWGWIAQGAIVTRADEIVWLGRMQDMPQVLYADIHATHDLQGACVTPGLIDCHTHLVYAGSRAREFELRLQGASYEQIAKAGGGIRSTVAATRTASDQTLLRLALRRARVLMHEGVSTIEIKSGYGLSEEHEARLLRVARQLGRDLGLTVKTTFLGAHAVPPEYEGRQAAYVDAVCEWLPRLHAQGLVDAVDVFCERIGFTLDETRKVLDAAKSLGLPVKLHAEQLSDQKGTVLAAKYDALSCDHLEYLQEDGVISLKNTLATAILLPGAYYFLRENQLPPIEALRAAGVPIALATDHNPGSSPTLSPLLMMNMACTLFRLTPEEAWRGFTVNAARALGLAQRYGVLRAGSRADFAIWRAEHPRELVYAFGQRALQGLVIAGELRQDVPSDTQAENHD